MVPKLLKDSLKDLLRNVGFSVERYQKTAIWRRQKLLSHYNINLLLDVGASDGVYAKIMRQHGYKGTIVSFEPLPFRYKILAGNARGDKFWDTVNIALGHYDGKAEINVAGNAEAVLFYLCCQSTCGALRLPRMLGRKRFAL